MKKPVVTETWIQIYSRPREPGPDGIPHYPGYTTALWFAAFTRTTSRDNGILQRWKRVR